MKRWRHLNEMITRWLRGVRTNLHAYPTLIPACVLIISVLAVWHNRPPISFSLCVEPGAATSHRDRRGGNRPDIDHFDSRDRSFGRRNSRRISIGDGAIWLFIQACLSRWPSPPGMTIGAIMGWINGVLVTIVRLPPFIVTLGTLSVFTALKLWYSHSESVRNADIEANAPFLLWFGNGFKAFGATITFGGIALILLAVLFWYILSHTAWGRHVHAIGDDPDAALLSGIRTKRTLISVYATAGLICGFGAWISIGRVGSVSPISFDDINLGSITAVVIGGTSLFGGRGSIPGSVLGAMIVGVFNTGLALAGVDDYWQMFAAGNLVLIAVALDQWLRRATR